MFYFETNATSFCSDVKKTFVLLRRFLIINFALYGSIYNYDEDNNTYGLNFKRNRSTLCIFKQRQ